MTTEQTIEKAIAKLCDSETGLLNIGKYDHDILRTTLEEVVVQEREKYQELLLAVSNKHEGETRHQTALRYIKQVEQVTSESTALTPNQENL